MQSRVIRKGETITYRRRAEDATAVVVAIDRVMRRGDMFGERVVELAWAERDFAFLTLAAGEDLTYCHGTELV